MEPAAWLHTVAWTYIGLCTLCAVYMIVDFDTHDQKMWIMYVVWPITALYFGPVAVWMYRRTRPVSTETAPEPEGETKERMKEAEPTREQVAVAVSHCGAGCTLGDIIGESAVFGLGIYFVAGSEFGTKLVVDFILAYVFGIFFQYFTIVPMRGLSFGQGLLAAVRADTISITLFEVGMFGWMAITRFLLFPEPHRIHPNMALFWFMMQLAMIAGWATAYPANVWLLRKKWKEKMPQYPSAEVRQMHTLPRRAA